MTRGNLKLEGEEEGEAWEASGKGREWIWEQLGALIRCLLTELSREVLIIMGKAQ